MSKYIDAEKLKAEIKERLHCNGSFDECGDTAWDYDQGMVAAYNYVLSFIDSLQQEQPEVDLEKEIEMYISSKKLLDYAFLVPSIARHFYGLRNRALEEAARHVYESWMGGTMDDVRRDMVELGKVLNARKEESK